MIYRSLFVFFLTLLVGCASKEFHKNIGTTDIGDLTVTSIQSTARTAGLDTQTLTVIDRIVCSKKSGQCQPLVPAQSAGPKFDTVVTQGLIQDLGLAAHGAIGAAITAGSNGAGTIFNLTGGNATTQNKVGVGIDIK